MTDNFNNKINAIDFDYYLENKRFISSKMSFIDKDLNKYNTKDTFIDLKNNRIAAKDIEIYFADGELGSNARLKGRSMISENNISVIKNGVFTTCEVRKDCPPWALKASEIKHDKSKKTIYYKDSWLNYTIYQYFIFQNFFILIQL